MQSLVAAIERLTQQNQELKHQMNLVNKRRAQKNNQHDEQHNDEHDDSHLPTRDQHEREDQEESNVASRRNRWEDTDHKSKLESNAMRMALDMQMMKDKMDMMMMPWRGECPPTWMN